MPTTDYHSGLYIIVTIRILAAVVFADLYVRERKPLQLAVCGAWVLYALSGILRIPVVFPVSPSPSVLQTLVLALAMLATAQLLYAAFCYVQPRATRHLRSFHLVLLVGALLPLPLCHLPAVCAYYYLGLQGLTGLIAFVAVVLQWRAAVLRLERALYALVLILGLAVVQSVLMLAGLFPEQLVTVSTPGLNMALVLFFIYAEHGNALFRLKRSAARLEQAESLSGIGYWERDLETGEAHWSSGHWAIFGLDSSRDEPGVDVVNSLVHPDDRWMVEEIYRRLKEGSHYEKAEYRLLLRDGQVRWVKADALQSLPEQHIFGVVQDITDQKLPAIELKRTLREKTTLIHEVHHRVKNNLQVILSIVRLRLGGVNDPVVQTAIGDIENRVQAMVQAHEHLLSAENLSAIHMPSFVERIVDDSLAVYQSAMEPPDIVLDIEELTLPLDRALPCGLILTELIVNACVHAFPAEAGAAAGANVIRVRLRREDAWVVLTVHDNGVGFENALVPDPTVDDSGRRLGYVFIATFVQQLGGAISVANDAGARVELRFPELGG